MSALLLLLYGGSVVAVFLLILATEHTPNLKILPAVLIWPFIWPLMLLVALVEYLNNAP